MCKIIMLLYVYVSSSNIYYFCYMSIEIHNMVTEYNFRELKQEKKNNRSDFVVLC